MDAAIADCLLIVYRCTRGCDATCGAHDYHDSAARPMTGRRRVDTYPFLRPTGLLIQSLGERCSGVGEHTKNKWFLAGDRVPFRNFQNLKKYDEAAGDGDGGWRTWRTYPAWSSPLRSSCLAPLGPVCWACRRCSGTHVHLNCLFPWSLKPKQLGTGGQGGDTKVRRASLVHYE